VDDVSVSNDIRAARVEAFLLQEAVLAGVVCKIEVIQPRNPNKWTKTLAPWFTDECRTAKKHLHAMKRLHPSSHPDVVLAVADFKTACAKGRRAFAASVPEMLKYKPK
jgi:hypothetical protein